MRSRHSHVPVHQKHPAQDAPDVFTPKCRLSLLLAEPVGVGEVGANNRVLGPLDGTAREFLLRRNHLGEERVVLALGRHYFVPRGELRLEDTFRRLEELHALLGLHLDIVRGVTVDCLPRHVGTRRLGGVADDGLQFRRQAVVLLLVEQDLEQLERLVIALQHADLGNIRETEQPVRGGVVELGRLDDAAVERRHDLAARQRDHGSAHLLEHVHRQTDSAVFEVLEVRRRFHLLLEPAERLGRHRSIEETDDVEFHDRVLQLVVQLLAAAVLDPGQQRVRVHAERRAGAEQRIRRVLAVPVGRHAVATVERAFVHRVDQVEGLDHRAGRQHVDLEPAARHFVHLLGEVEGVLVEDILGRPGALEPHRGRGGTANHRKAERRGAGGRGRGGGEKPATSGDTLGRRT